MEFDLPNRWSPREYQLPLWTYLEDGGTRAIEIAHRRWGKDEVCLHWGAVAAHQRIGNYWHLLPKADQARKAIWDAINPRTGKKRIDEAFPPALRSATRQQEMMIEFVSGSTWQVGGSDNYETLIGAPPIGIVFSEWAKAKPEAWAFLQPILEENGGWALFITTPRGKNHAYQMLERAKTQPRWFAEVQSNRRTKRFNVEQLQDIEDELATMFGRKKAKALVRQEYFCDFDVIVGGDIIPADSWRKWPHKDPPKCIYLLQSWDTAFEEDDQGDERKGRSPAFTARTDWGVFKHEGEHGISNHLILLGRYKDRPSFPDLRRIARRSYEEFQPDRVLIEKKASGHSLLQELRRNRVPASPWSPDRYGDKVARAHAAAPTFEAGMVWYMDRDWAGDVISDCSLFPEDGKDITDTVTQAVLWFRKSFLVEFQSEQDEREEDEKLAEAAADERRVVVPLRRR